MSLPEKGRALETDHADFKAIIDLPKRVNEEDNEAKCDSKVSISFPFFMLYED